MKMQDAMAARSLGQSVDVGAILARQVPSGGTTTTAAKPREERQTTLG